MGYPVAYLSGNTTTYETGMFKRGTIGQNQAAALTGSYRWWNGIDVTSSQYLIYSDTFTTSATTAANATPAAWSTPDLTDQSLLNLINTLPERIGKLPFTYLPVALQWIQSTGRYFLLKNGYENIVTNGLTLNLDASWYLSYSGTGTNWKDLSSRNNNLTLVNSPLLKTDNSVYFSIDNTDDFGYIDVTSGSGLGDSNSNTLCMWVKNINNNFLMNGKYGSHFGYGFYSGGLLKNSSGEVGPSITPYYNKSYWTHLTAVWDSGNSQTRLYINGELTGTSSVSYFSNANGGRIVIGGAYNSNGTLNKEGSVDIACYHQYNRVLTNTEIVQNFNAQKTRFGFTANTLNTSGLILDLDAGSIISYPTTGTSWYDVSYNNYNGTLTNGPTYDSTYGGSIVFDGSDDYVNLPTGLLSGTGDFTIIQWVQSNGNSVGTTFGNYPSGNLQFGWSQNYVFLWLDNASAYASTSYFTTGTTMISGRRIGTVTNYLKNGVVISTGSSNASIGNSNANFRLGTNIQTSEQFNGKIYRTIVYNRGLSDSEILQIYNSQKSRYGL